MTTTEPIRLRLRLLLRDPCLRTAFSSARQYDHRQKRKDENCKSRIKGRYQVLRLRVGQEARQYEGHVSSLRHAFASSHVPLHAGGRHCVSVDGTCLHWVP